MSAANLFEVNVKDASLHRTKVPLVYASVLRDFAGTPAWTAGITPAGKRFRGAVTHSLVCPLCRREEFHVRQVQLASALNALLDADWAAPAAYAMSCTSCSHILWFSSEPRERT